MVHSDYIFLCKKFAKLVLRWFNIAIKNITNEVKKKLISKYLVKDSRKIQSKSTDINVLLNRVKLNQKNESRKKIYFSAAASAGLVLFGFILF